MGIFSEQNYSDEKICIDEVQEVECGCRITFINALGISLEENYFDEKISVDEVQEVECHAYGCKITFTNGHTLGMTFSEELCAKSLFFNPDLELCLKKKILGIRADENINDHPKVRFYNNCETEEDKINGNEYYYISNDSVLNINTSRYYRDIVVNWRKYLIKLDDKQNVVLWSFTLSDGSCDTVLELQYI